MKTHTSYLTFTTKKRQEIIDITEEVEKCRAAAGISEGMVLVSAMHISILARGSGCSTVSGMASVRSASSSRRWESSRDEEADLAMRSVAEWFRDGSAAAAKRNPILPRFFFGQRNRVSLVINQPEVTGNPVGPGLSYFDRYISHSQTLK